MSEAISLYQLNQIIKQEIQHSFPSDYWIKAEISECRENSNGHCYLELIEKDSQTDRLIAKTKASIWSFTYKMLKPYFESSTGQSFTSGLKILVAVHVEFHELYGINLVVKDIDPTYTVGDMVQRRVRILNQLKNEGVLEMNKELELPVFPQRIAVISSSTAAGYDDFMQQLLQHKKQYRFYCKLFPAVMQGAQTESSIIEALEKIYLHIDSFDVVVIIRGGGATADLSSFDSYNLAYFCTQFPLPIFTGIGHQRDQTILDFVAHTSLKTPTAVAEKLIEILQEKDVFLENSFNRILHQTAHFVQIQSNYLQQTTVQLAHVIKETVDVHENELDFFLIHVKSLYTQSSLLEKQKMTTIIETLNKQTLLLLKNKKQRLSFLEKNIKLVSPDSILARGYSITSDKNGKMIKTAHQLLPGDEIITRFSDGSISSIIKK